MIDAVELALPAARPAALSVRTTNGGSALERRPRPERVFREDRNCDWLYMRGGLGALAHPADGRARRQRAGERSGVPAAMSRKVAVVYEAAADFAIATDLADRKLVECSVDRIGSTRVPRNR